MSEDKKKPRRQAEPDPRVFSRRAFDDAEEAAKRVHTEPDYQRRADEALRQVVSKNLRLVLPQ